MVLVRKSVANQLLPSIRHFVCSIKTRNLPKIWEASNFRKFINFFCTSFFLVIANQFYFWPSHVFNSHFLAKEIAFKTKANSTQWISDFCCFRLKAILSERNVIHFNSGQKWPKNYHLAMVEFKYVDGVLKRYNELQIESQTLFTAALLPKYYMCQTQLFDCKSRLMWSLWVRS